jgi:hypothetical protein
MPAILSKPVLYIFAHTVRLPVRYEFVYLAPVRLHTAILFCFAPFYINISSLLLRSWNIIASPVRLQLSKQTKNANF